MSYAVIIGFTSSKSHHYSEPIAPLQRTNRTTTANQSHHYNEPTPLCPLESPQRTKTPLKTSKTSLKGTETGAGGYETSRGKGRLECLAAS